MAVRREDWAALMAQSLEERPCPHPLQMLLPLFWLNLRMLTELSLHVRICKIVCCVTARYCTYVPLLSKLRMTEPWFKSDAGMRVQGEQGYQFEAI